METVFSYSRKLSREDASILQKSNSYCKLMLSKLGLRICIDTACVFFFKNVESYTGSLSDICKCFLRRRKNTIKETLFFSRNLQTETRASWEKVTLDSVHRSGAKSSLTIGKCHRKVSETFCHSTEKPIGETFCYFWQFLMMMEVSADPRNFWRCFHFGSKFFGELQKRYHKKMLKSFCGPEKLRGGLLVFLIISGTKKLFKTGESRFFFNKRFSLKEPKNFVKEPFCVSEFFWHRKILCMKMSVTIFRREFFLSLYQRFSNKRVLMLVNCLFVIDCTCML